MIWLLLACRGPDAPADSAAAGDDTAAPVPTSADAGPDLAGEVGAAIAFAGGGTGARFRWSFGDGAEAEGRSVTHAYAEPGNYVAVLSVEGEDGSVRTDAARVAVYPTPAAVAPTASRTLVVDGRDVWVVNPEAGSVAQLDDGFLTAEFGLCGGPRTLALDGTTLGVACETSDQLVLFDTVRRTVTATVPFTPGARPYGVAGRDGTFWVSLQATGEVAEVHDGALVALHPVGPDPRGVALDPDGGVWVTRFRSPQDHAEVYRVGGAPVSLALHPGPDSDTAMGGVPNLLDHPLVTPDGGRLWLPGLQANVGRGLWRSGEPLTFETTVRAALSVVDLPGGAEDVGARKQFDNQDRVGPIAFGPHGTWAFVAHPGTGTVQAVDAFTLDVVSSLLGAGEGITGLAWHDGVLYVHAWLDRTVTAWAWAHPGDTPSRLWRTGTLGHEPLPPEILLGQRLFHDSGDPRLARDGYIACASCHPDGRDDGLTWDFTDRGEGLRNTASLEGRAGTGMGPLHWTANFDEVQDFEGDIRGAFGGTGLLDDADWAETPDPLGAPKAGRSADLDALAAFVGALATPPASPTPTDLGKDAFVAAGCGECHGGAAYTDSDLAAPVRHDVGTLTAASGQRLGGALDGLDTPTLLGVHATAPYLHDGSAPTVEAAIRAHRDVHLDDATLAEVAAYVRGL